MTFDWQLSLSLELTKLFPERAVTAGLRSFLNEVRRFRNSGSDLLVEEELADVFARGRINPDLEASYRTVVLYNNENLGVKEFGDKQGIFLDQTPGPTLERALAKHKDPEGSYMRTIIQVSLLCWMHGRSHLATALSECLTMRAPPDTPSAGVEAVQGMLDASFSQTAAFNWSSYVLDIEKRIVSTFPAYEHHSDFMTLSPKQLLACLDYLYITQRLPEDRKVIMETQMGFITIIIWAHMCLDLSVQVSGIPGGDIAFGDPSHPQVIIKWQVKVLKPDVYLLDKNAKVVLTPEEPGHNFIQACERLPIQDYGTHLLWRSLNWITSTSQESQVFTDAVHYVLTMAIVSASNLVRFEQEEQSWDSRIRRWQIYDAAKVFFKSVHFDESIIENFVKKTEKGAPLYSVPVPGQLHQFLEKIQPGSDILNRVQLRMMRLSSLVVAFAAVANVQDCAQMPIAADVNIVNDVGFASAVQI